MNLPDIIYIILSLISIPLWLLLPWAIRKVKDKHKNAYDETEHDFDKLGNILEGDNAERDLKKYLKEIKVESNNKKYWFWETDADLFITYCLITLISTIALIKTMVDLFK